MGCSSCEEKVCTHSAREAVQAVSGRRRSILHFYLLFATNSAWPCLCARVHSEAVPSIGRHLDLAVHIYVAARSDPVYIVALGAFVLSKYSC